MTEALAVIRGRQGQATVELVGLLPLIIAVGLAVFCVLAAGQARELADHAAAAGAVALLQDGDPESAARAAIARREVGSFRVSVRDRVVTVEIRPRLPMPALAPVLSATRSADAGPESRP